MGHIKKRPSTWEPPDYDSHPFTTIVVAALRENKRPVGFAPWPEPEKAAKKRKKK